MKKILIGTALCALFATPVFAAPITMSDAQLNVVSAGSHSDNKGNGNGNCDWGSWNGDNNGNGNWARQLRKNLSVDRLAALPKQRPVVVYKHAFGGATVPLLTKANRSR